MARAQDVSAPPQEVSIAERAASQDAPAQQSPTSQTPQQNLPQQDSSQESPRQPPTSEAAPDALPPPTPTAAPAPTAPTVPDDTPPSASALPGRRPPAQLTLPQICSSARNTPEETKALVDATKTTPSAASYDALGDSFAQHKLTGCAASAYQIAAHLDDSDWQAHYGLGEASIARGDKKHAAEQLEKAAELNPISAQVHYALGELFQGQDKLPQAQAEYETVVQLDPHFPYAASHLAEVLIAQKLSDEAIEPLRKASALSPPPEEQAVIELQLGRLYAAKHDSSKAFAALQKAIASNPDSAAAHFELGNLYAVPPRKNVDAAITEYQTTLDLQPGNAAAQLALGQLLLGENRYVEALPYLREYSKANPNDGDAYHLQVLAYQSLQQWPQAADAALQEVRLDPKNLDWRREAAALLAEAHRYGAALAQLEAAESLNPKIPEIHEQLIFLYRQSGQLDRAQQERLRYEALERDLAQKDQARDIRIQADQVLAQGSAAAAYDQYREALRLDPSSGEAHFSLALALDHLGDRADERRELQRAIELSPNLAPAHNQLGLLDFADGKRGDAEAQFKAAVDIDPKFAEARNNLGVLYIQQGNIREAIVMFEEAVEEQPSYASAFVNLANALIGSGRLDEAEKRLHAALQANPNDGAVYIALGKLELKREHPDAALVDFHQAVELAPNSPEAHLELGRALEDHCDRHAAFENFSRAESLDSQSVAAHVALGRFFYEAANYEGAREQLSAALHIDPNSPEALYLLGLTEAQANNFDLAAEHFQQVVAIDSNQSNAQYLLGLQLKKLDRNDEAIEHWKLAAQASRPSPQALAHLSQAFAKTDELEAQNYDARLQELLRAAGGPSNDDALHRASQAEKLEIFGLESAGAQDWPQAIADMRDAIAACKKCSIASRLHRHLGLFYCRTGRIELARAELAKALSLDPNDAEARHASSALANIH